MKDSDLIRRSDAVALCDFYKGDDDAAVKIKYELLNSERAVPAVDAVEGVVRCRECRHYKPSRYNAGTKHYCGVIDGFPKEHWFCADGQRREDGDNGKHL